MSIVMNHLDGKEAIEGNQGVMLVWHQYRGHKMAICQMLFSFEILTQDWSLLWLEGLIFCRYYLLS